MGVDPEIQNAVDLDNIIAPLRGTDSGKAILVVGHYDTVATSPGASDDGAAVSSMLETLRALRAGPPLKNDVIFLFTDGEERGLLGAKAFVYKHPSARDIGVVLNFEARGNGGPSIMFETNDQNGGIIKEFAEAADYPVANSLTSDLYKLLPNDTDFTVFKEQGLQGLNFAYIAGAAYYHTPLDEVKNIDERSLQHHGAYALSLTRHFGDLSREPVPEGNEVYFNIPGRVLLFYPYGWAIPIAVLVLVLFISVTVLGFKRGFFKLEEAALGLAAFPASVIAIAIAVTIATDVAGSLHEGGVKDASFGEVFYIIGVAALSTAVACALNLWFQRRVTVQNLTLAAMFWCLIFMLITSFLLPGGSYLFTWPLLFGLAGLAITFASTDLRYASIARSVAVSCCAIPAIILFVPMIYLLFIGLTLNMSAVVSAVVAFALALLVQPLNMILKSTRWLLPGAAALIGLGFIVAAA